MMIFKQAIPRRTFLRGVGATLGLPLLDGMVPAFASNLDGGGKAAVRLSIVYVPNGIIMDKWSPKSEGVGFELTPVLEQMKPIHDRMLVLSGLSNEKAASQQPGEDGAPHVRAGSSFLTGVRPKQAEGADIRAGVSADQFAARELGKHTQLASLELSMDSTEFVGACEPGYSCAYMNTLCWRTPTTPIPMENNPRAVFERLFGDSDSTDRATRMSRMKKDRSILDSLTKEVSRVVNGLGPSDRAKVTEWTEAIRDVERRIQIAEEQSSKELPPLERPAGIPASYEEHVKLMFDLQVLAFQCDMTRVITFMMGREASARVYRELGITDQHHPLTHHRNDAASIAKVIQINIYHAKMFAYFLEKMSSTPDGEGSLLDRSIVLYGSGISDGNQHLRNNLPILLTGGGVGQIKGGRRHIRYPDETPMANLYLTLLDRLGIPVETLGNSTGKVELLPV